LKNNGSVSQRGLWMAMVYPSGHLDRQKHDDEPAGDADVGTVGISGF